MNKSIIFRMVRWMIIIAFLLLVMYGISPHPFSLEESMKEPLKSMEFPSNTEVVSTAREGNIYSVLFEDKENALFHQANFKKMLGLFWVYKGGSIGFERNEETLSRMYWGMSTIDGRRIYEVYGYSNDSNVSYIKSNWLKEDQKIKLDENGYFHFIKEVEGEKELNHDLEVDFYQSKGKFSYKLDHMKNEILKDQPVAKIQKGSRKEMPIDVGKGSIQIEYIEHNIDTTVHAFELDPSKQYEIVIKGVGNGIPFGPAPNVRIKKGEIEGEIAFSSDSNGELQVSMNNPTRILGTEVESTVIVREVDGPSVLETIPFLLEQ